MTIERWLREHYYVPQEVIDEHRVLINGCRVYSMNEEVEQGDQIIVIQSYDLGIKTYVVD